MQAETPELPCARILCQGSHERPRNFKTSIQGELERVQGRGPHRRRQYESRLRGQTGNQDCERIVEYGENKKETRVYPALFRFISKLVISYPSTPAVISSFSILRVTIPYRLRSIGYLSVHLTEVAAPLKYERMESIDVAFDSLLWTTYYILNAGAAGGYFYEYHRTFSKKDGSLVDSTIFNPDEKEKIVLLLRKYAEKYDANPKAIGMNFQLEPSFLKEGIGFDGSSFEIGWHTHGSVMIVVPYEEILPYMQTWVRRKFGF